MASASVEEFARTVAALEHNSQPNSQSSDSSGSGNYSSSRDSTFPATSNPELASVEELASLLAPWHR